ncbi:MAG TPA: hypothetical protein VGO57_07705 [Verrucomicrobiae bacterium]|jgi:hypothetical protein
MRQAFSLHLANKKVGKTFVSDFRTLASQQEHRFSLRKVEIPLQPVKRKCQACREDFKGEQNGGQPRATQKSSPPMRRVRLNGQRSFSAIRHGTRWAYSQDCLPGKFLLLNARARAQPPDFDPGLQRRSAH